jgi:dipeptide transport system ATP-binding protein
MNEQVSLLTVENLSVDFRSRNKRITAVESVNFDVYAGETVAVVGESGSGKSVTALAIMGLIREPGIIRSGAVNFNGEDLLALSSRQRRKYLGRNLSIIFQEPASSLNPSFSIGYQITEVLKLHENLSHAQRYNRALDLISEVGISDPVKCLKLWPHQLSGGMNQRVMIAMAISCNPSLLIADEPTTALDVTVQAQILGLLRSLQQKNNMGMIFITHDLSVVSSIARRVVVMYAGQVVESCLATDLFQQPQHPYTEALLKSLPTKHSYKNERLYSIKGSPPKVGERLLGCRFFSRCNYAKDHCREESPKLINDLQSNFRAVRCFYPLTNAKAPDAGHV